MIFSKPFFVSKQIKKLKSDLEMCELVLQKFPNAIIDSDKSKLYFADYSVTSYDGATVNAHIDSQLDCLSISIDYLLHNEIIVSQLFKRYSGHELSTSLNVVNRFYDSLSASFNLNSAQFLPEKFKNEFDNIIVEFCLDRIHKHNYHLNKKTFPKDIVDRVMALKNFV